MHSATCSVHVEGSGLATPRAVDELDALTRKQPNIHRTYSNFAIIHEHHTTAYGGPSLASQIVEEEDALTSKQRARGGAPLPGSLRFKGDDDSASARFVDSAFKKVAEAEAALYDPTAAQGEGEGGPSEAGAGGSSGAIVFRSGAERKAGNPAGKKRPPTKDGLPAAKAVKNPGLLSFVEDDD